MSVDYAIVGLGVSGCSAAKFLMQQGHSVVVYDDAVTKVEQFCQLHPTATAADNINDIRAATTIVVSPGIDTNNSFFNNLRQAGKKIIGDIEIFAQHADVPIVAITGSNGKSTVTALVAFLLQQHGLNVGLGGNFGIPALDLLHNNYDIYVLEVSSFQLLTTTSLKPLSAAVLNISPDHLDRHGTFEHYQQAKLSVYNHAKNAIYNLADKLTYSSAVTGRVIGFGFDNVDGFHLKPHNNRATIFYKQNSIISVDKLKLVGNHNYENVIAALTIANSVKELEVNKIKVALEQFEGLPHRCEIVAQHKAIWINDSKGTNVGATVVAISSVGEAIRGKVILLAGGLAKDKDFSLLAEIAAKYCKHIILFGADKLLLQQALVKKHQHITLVEDMAQAISLANQHAVAGDAVLLSPACTSFDMFSNYIERGNVFKSMVLENLRASL